MPIRVGVDVTIRFPLDDCDVDDIPIDRWNIFFFQNIIFIEFYLHDK